MPMESRDEHPSKSLSPQPSSTSTLVSSVLVLFSHPDYNPLSKGSVSFSSTAPQCLAQGKAMVTDGAHTSTRHGVSKNVPDSP